MVKNFTFRPMFRPSGENFRPNRFFGNDICKIFCGGAQDGIFAGGMVPVIVETAAEISQRFQVFRQA